MPHFYVECQYVSGYVGKNHAKSRRVSRPGLAGAAGLYDPGSANGDRTVPR